MLRIENLSVAVRGKQILKNINLHIAPGEVHVLFGPNGTGKSTLIGTIMGFERYEVLEGKIYFKGQDITDAPCYERAKMGVGVMIQRPPTIRGLSLRQMISICGATPEETEKMAEWMGLSDFLDRSVNEGFSGGELKRSELLQLMAQKPDLLLLDEPVSGIDQNGMELFYRNIEYLKENFDLAVLLISHDLDYVRKYADHVVLIDGKVLTQGTPKEVYDSDAFKQVFTDMEVRG